ncbi:hypothetical protein N431DRAFT_443222 [Stipitochalara longipes BDJ]|nr:hypothetical protein N431DRAFT_443222 [Stipitochalara longipes BDJ]
MSSPGQQQGGGQGAGSGGQSSPNQPTTISRTTSPTSTSSLHNSPTSTSTSSGVHKGAIIGGIVGGVAGLLLISFLGIWLLQRRKQRQNGARAGKTRPITYTGLNSVFRGVPFNRSSSQSPHNSLLPQPQVSQGTHSTLQGVALRGGAANYGLRESGSEMDNLPPSYAESQMSTSMASLGRMNTTYRSESETLVSPLSARAPGAPHIISPQTTGASTFMSLQHLWATNEPHTISPQTTGASVVVQPYTAASEDPHLLTPQPPRSTSPVLLPQHTRDTMGFPIEPEEIRLPPAMPTTIVSPVPRHPLVRQDSLERVVRQGLMPSDSPEPSNLNPDRLRVLSQEIPRESPILGLNTVRIAPEATANNGVSRYDTQRTVSSESSIGISVVSDGELERLGVGVDSRARYHRPAKNGGN